MASTLADSLAVVLRRVPAALVEPAQHRHLLELARALPPLHFCGFEVRLNGSCEVDFQQGIGARDGQPGVFRQHLDVAGLDSGLWQQLGRFVSEWEHHGSALHTGVTDLWLEFDRPPEASLSVFVGFAKSPEPALERLRRARAALSALAETSAPHAFDEALTRCVEACPEGTYLSHIGLMLSRPSPFLRLQVMRPEPHEITTYLKRVAWGHDVQPVVELAYSLREHAHGLAICLDVAEQVGPCIGLEALFDQQPPGEILWRSLLDDLVRRGLCAASKRDALLAWPGVTSPANLNGAWPADLVRAALRQPADHFTSFERRLSHVKVVYEPGETTEAKAYFGYEHKWLRPGLGEDNRALQRAGHRSRPLVLAQSVATAASFLLESRTSIGLWQDFSGTLETSAEWRAIAGWSDEWVSAYVACSLGGQRGSTARQAAQRAWSVLAQRRMPLGGWGYNRLLPVDGDSTAWGLRLARAVGATSTAAARLGCLALERHRLPDGGIATYLETDCPKFDVPSLIPPHGSYAGWCSTSHPCVTAATAGLGDANACAFLRRAQRTDGSWASYWWREDEYATALAAESLARSASAADSARVQAAVSWALARTASDGSVEDSPFATALALTTLALRGDDSSVREAIVRTVAWLVERQDPDGGWAASARLISPRPDVTDRDSSSIAPIATLDDARAFTVATVLSALTRAHHVIG